MKENEILKEVIKEFLKAVDRDCDNAEKAVESYDDFYEFIEDHEDLKEKMYGFFYKMLDNYVLFKFYTSPIPALVENKEYMDKYKNDVMETARTFFNFGGIIDENIH